MIISIPTTTTELKSMTTRQLTALLRQEGVSISRDDRKPELLEKATQLVLQNVGTPPTPEPTEKPKKKKSARVPYQTGQDYPADPQNYEKGCPSCGEVKQLSEFGCRKMSAGPRPQTWCNPCRSDRARMTKNTRKREELAKQGLKTLSKTSKLKKADQPAYMLEELELLQMNRLQRTTGREIDKQMSRHYKVDGFVTSKKAELPVEHIKTLAGAQDIVDGITKDAWFVQRFGKIKVEVVKSASKIGVSRSSTDHDVKKNTIELCFSRAGKALLHILLHELAHSAIQAATELPHASHGPLYCQVLLDIVGYVQGPEYADQLRAAYDQHGVDYVSDSEACKTQYEDEDEAATKAA